MKKTFVTGCIIFCAVLLLLESGCSKNAENENKTVEEIFEEEVLSDEIPEEELPPEVMLESYSHPYRWNKTGGEKIQFKEIWGYVVAERIADWEKDTPLTDIGLFAVEVDCYGNLQKAPSRNLVKDFKGRVHLVAVCQSTSLTHFVVDPRFGKRDRLVRELLAAAKEFDGLQIDYELVPKLDGEDFAAFLRLLKKGLGKKPLTVCVPARLRTIKDDVYDYARLSKICDKVMVMAYDEHWATSEAGSVASMDWCRNIGEYMLGILPQEKYIIGVPFYGRSWQSERLAQAWAFNGANRIMHENNVKKINRENGIPYFEYETTVRVTFWYDDATSLSERCRMYREQGFENIAFWRMGQEDAEFWNRIEVQE